MLKYEGVEYDKSEGLAWQEKVLYPQGSERIRGYGIESKKASSFLTRTAS